MMEESRAAERLGEFLVIVIGVFVALTAESWLSRSAERELVSRYEVDLLDDLRADSSELATWSALMRLRVEMLSRMLHDLNGGEQLAGPEMLSTLHIAAIVPDPAFSRVTIDDLASTGSLRLLDRAVRRALLDYVIQAETIKKNIDVWDLGKPGFTGVVPGVFQGESRRC
jgi:hypothetical protein